MNRFVATAALFLLMLGSGALAQDADDLSDVEKRVLTEDGRQLRSNEEIAAYLAAMEAKKREELDSACDRPKDSLSHALVELCSWIGQYR